MRPSGDVLAMIPASRQAFDRSDRHQQREIVTRHHLFS
jgi:hypothetical protein